MIVLKEKQSVMFEDPMRFIVAATARRFGKTTTFATKMYTKAFQRSGLYAYCAPTYKQAKLIAWDIFKDILPRRYKLKVNESDLAITVPSAGGKRSVVRLFGLDKAEGLLGIKLHGCIIDEYDQTKAGIYQKIIRPALSDTKGFCWFLGNPDGTKRRLKELFDRVKTRQLPDWSAYQFKATDGGYIDQEEIDAARNELDERTFREQYEGSFEDVTGQVYYGFSLEHNVRNNLVYNPNLPLCIYWDFNVTPFTVGFAQVYKRVDDFRQPYDEVHCIDEFAVPNSNTPEMCRLILEKYGQHKTGVRVYGDATAKARNTASSLSDYQIILEHFKNLPGLSFRFKTSNPFVKDRVNAVNSMLCNIAGKRRVFMHGIRCKHLIRDMTTVSRRENSSEIDKSDPELTHASDGLGYFIEYEYPVIKTFIRS